jgi:hypothetical protein
MRSVIRGIVRFFKSSIPPRHIWMIGDSCGSGYEGGRVFGGKRTGRFQGPTLEPVTTENLAAFALSPSSPRA